MVNCGACTGSGRRTCPGCYGKRYKSSLDGNYNMQMSPCLVCGASGRVRCDFCGGRGRITTPEAQQRPSTGDASFFDASGDPLAGQWNADSGYWTFIRDGDAYRVEETSALGRTANGIARRNGAEVVVAMGSVLIGNQEYRFTLGDGVLSGTVRMLFMNIPVVLRKA